MGGMDFGLHEVKGLWTYIHRAIDWPSGIGGTVQAEKVWMWIP